MTYADGVFVSAFSFDGTSTVQFGHLGAASPEGTIDFWLRPPVDGDSHNIFSTNGGGDNGIRFAADLKSGSSFAVVGNLSGSNIYGFTSDMVPDTWHHVALVWGRDGVDIDAYYDGLLRFTTSANPFFENTFSDSSIGDDWEGLIDVLVIVPELLIAL